MLMHTRPSAPNFADLGAPTKGRLAVADGFRWNVLGVGADGEVVFADSAEDTGLRWGAIASPPGGIYTTVSSEQELIDALLAQESLIYVDADITAT